MKFSWAFTFWLTSVSCKRELVSVVPNQEQDTYCYKNEQIHKNGEQIQSGFSYKAIPNGNGTVFIAGNVQEVLQGRVPPGTEGKTLSAHGLVGFGAGAIGSITGLGETIYANGMAHVRTTDNKSEFYFQTIRDSKFITPFAIFMRDDMTGHGIATYTSPEQWDGSNYQEFNLLQLYQNIYKSVNTIPFCYHGIIKFDQLDGIAPSKAPIYGEPLFGENLKHYYTYPPFQLQGVEAIVVGCCANFSTIHDPMLKEKLTRGLYSNPLDQGSASELMVHSHAMTVTQCNLARSRVLDNDEGPGQVYHLLSNSSIREFRVKVFKIDSIDKFQDLVPNGSKFSAVSHPILTFAVIIILRILSGY